ncbi:DUF4153 domain-containing protein [Nocardioides jishulii]|uniref:histidine kinase n=1 Tax=Nocardioides jishulii TaxID=2575440 RepID=A0A4U2YMI4_9ACTN|nr:DUF4153 domain-containing protein [Nocardioides jishulii]QCX27328.1 DUF4173 domain-containing protein [Nocardioides jishulii]TKI61815.1 DUF4173 domain-containing protein [Nocardioides jishulii]
MSALTRISSIKVKLGLLVVAASLVTALVATVGSAAGVSPWLTLPVTLFLALLVTQLLASGMVAPLVQMTEAARAMARGAYDARVLTANADEVGELARSFNVMAADLQRVDAERRDLIATVSHELRTPVAALSAQLENLADGVVEPTPERLGSTLASAERLGDLLADLLALSRLEAGVVDLDPVAVDLSSLVAGCAEEVAAAGRDVDIEVDVPADMQVWADPVRLRQLLINGLDNAARHAPEGTAVEVHAGGGEDGSWWLEVLDAGAGVAPADRERVFERFGTDAEGGGTGLGLAVSRWVARLHGGSLAFVDPEPGRTGARLRLEVPGPRLVAARSGATPQQVVPAPAFTVPVGSAPGTTPVPADDSTAFLFGGRWPERRPDRAPWIVAAAALVGVLAAATVVGVGPGLMWSLVLVAAGAVAWTASPRRTQPFTVLCTTLATAAVLSMTIHLQGGVTALALFAAAGTFLAGVTGATTLRGMLVSGLAWPMSALRGLAWLGRSLQVTGHRSRRTAVVRTVAASLVGLAVFGFLLVSADAMLTDWVTRLVPDISVDTAVARTFVALAIGGMTLAAAYLALNPPEVDPRPGHGLTATNRWEWVVPVLAVVAVFAVFVVVQVTVVIGGDAYVRRTTGLTYSEYARQGFFQMVLATALALVVVWLAARRAGTTTRDRRWLIGTTGALCLLVLGVVATALGRLAVYQDAYGYTVARVLAYAVEGWLGLVVLAVMVLGAVGRGAFVPRVALVSGTAIIVALSWFNTSAWVAERNIDRYEATGKLDLHYLSDLGDAAFPVVVERLPASTAACVWEFGPHGDGMLPMEASEPVGLREWTWDRARAEEALSHLRDQEVEDLPAGCYDEY